MMMGICPLCSDMIVKEVCKKCPVCYDYGRNTKLDRVIIMAFAQKYLAPVASILKVEQFRTIDTGPMCTEHMMEHNKQQHMP